MDRHTRTDAHKFALVLHKSNLKKYLACSSAQWKGDEEIQFVSS